MKPIEILNEGFKEKDGVVYYDELITPDVNWKTEPRKKRHWSLWRQKNYDFFIRELNKLKADNILVDVGAGRNFLGDITKKFKSWSLDFFPFAGVDLVYDLDKGLPFKENTVNVIIYSNVLEHVKEPKKVLAEASRVLVKDGIFLASIPFLTGVHQRPHDYYRYTDINLRYLMEENNFREVEIIPVLHFDDLIFRFLKYFFRDILKREGIIKKIVISLIWALIKIEFRIIRLIAKDFNSNLDHPQGYLIKALK